jgi:hypothetical protein
VTLDGQFVDGAGVVWALSEIAIEGDLPWNGPAAAGTWKAVGTRDDGATIKLEGSFDLCVAESKACPN